MEKPQESHLEIVKHIFCYLKGTIDFGIFNQKGNSIIVKGFQIQIGLVTLKIENQLVGLSLS
jgi:hypothetical protein